MDLARIELQALLAVAPSKPACRYAFIGSGPLPLTSLCILEASKCRLDHCVTCFNIDRDPKSVYLASRVSQILGYSDEEMAFQCADASYEMIELDQFDVVYFAALVGCSDREKHSILAHVVGHMRQGAMLVLRSSHSLRSLLYPVSLEQVI